MGGKQAGWMQIVGEVANHQNKPSEINVYGLRVCKIAILNPVKQKTLNNLWKQIGKLDILEENLT